MYKDIYEHTNICKEIYNKICLQRREHEDILKEICKSIYRYMIRYLIRYIESAKKYLKTGKNIFN